MTTLSVGIIGCGFMGSKYARIVYESRGVRLAGVADSDEGKANDLGRCWGVPAYKDFQDLLKKEDLQAVIVASSDQHHATACIAAAEAGKHIFVEKPLARTKEDGESIIKATREAGVVLLVGHTLRFEPIYHDAWEAISSGKIGEVLHMYARRNGPLEESGRRLGERTSVAFYLGIHDIDFINWCLKSKLRRVYARAQRKLLRDLNTDDTIFSLLEYENGVLACVESSWIMPSCRGPNGSSNFEAVGTKGVIHIHPNEQGLTIQHAEDMEKVRAFEEPIMHGRQWGEYNYEVEHFLDCIEKGTEVFCSGEEALQAVIAVEAIHTSVTTNTHVEID